MTRDTQLPKFDEGNWAKVARFAFAASVVLSATRHPPGTAAIGNELPRRRAGASPTIGEGRGLKQHTRDRRTFDVR
jgi:hypothetical protein